MKKSILCFAIIATTLLSGTITVDAQVSRRRRDPAKVVQPKTTTTPTTTEPTVVLQPKEIENTSPTVSRPSTTTQTPTRRGDAPSRGKATNNAVITDGSQLSFTVGGVTFVMIGVNGGSFTMGREKTLSTAGYDTPQHTVYLNSFYIGQTEVTQALWKAVMGKPAPCMPRIDNNPAVGMSWKQCKEFITKLNALTGKTFRLPTEAEWEFAARGGSKSTGMAYSGSNDLGSVAWNNGNSGGALHQVATKDKNELGIYDMSGNAGEWCSDYYARDYYETGAARNPSGPLNGTDRVVRGGDFNGAPVDCHVATRAYTTPDYGTGTIGFRLVLEP